MRFDVDRALPYLSPIRSIEDTGPIHAYGSKDGPVARAFSSTLLINYMVDEPGAAMFVRERDVDGEGGHDSLHRRAVANLRAHAAGRKLRFERSGEGGAMWQVKLDGQHEASLLLLDELWDPPTRILDPDGEIVVALPGRSRVVFSGTTARAGLAGLRALLAEAGDRALSPELFVRRSSAWAALPG